MAHSSAWYLTTYIPLKKLLTARAAYLTTLTLLVVVPLSVHAGVLSGFFAGADSAEANTSINKDGHSDVMVFDVPLLSPEQNPNPQGGRGGAEIVVVDGALMSSGPIGADDVSNISLTSDEISVYTVREGDSLSLIADMFGVTTNTILWANDLASAKSIKAGDNLIILPIAGVRYKIKAGDTIAGIAKTYGGNAEEIVAYNQLSSGAALAAGSTIIIPGGTVPAPARPKAVAKAGATGKGSTGFIHPLPGAMRTQGIHGFNAVDLAASVGAPIKAAAAGEVIVAKSGGWNGGYGNYIVIRHTNGTQTLYAHNSSNAVSVGSRVAQGEVIGYVGNTGRSTGSHLHFEVRGAKNPF